MDKNRHKNCIVFLLCWIGLLTGCKAQPLSFEETLATELSYAGELQDTLDAAMQSTDVIGVSVAIIVDGVGMWTGTSGESYHGKPVTPDMLFDLGSSGKLLAGPLMVKLVEDGLISLDDPISKYLPDFPYADGAITIRQLLNHTSGLYMMVDSPNGPFRKPFSEIDHEKWWTIDEIFTSLGGEPYHAPGSGYCYTQAGYQISTLIVEEVTDSTMAEQIQTRLLDPLGINGMYLDYSKPLPDNFELVHSWLDLDYDGDYDDIHTFSQNWIASLSRIYYHSRARDFAIWGHALFTGEVLNQDSMDLLLDFYRTDDWCGDDVFLLGYGMGVQDFNPAISAGQPAWGHLGSIQGARTYLAHLYQQGITIVIMVNTDTDNAMPIVDGLLGIVLKHMDHESIEPQTLDLNPVLYPPEGATVVKTFNKEALFCDHDPNFVVTASQNDWIDISLDWVVGSDQSIAEEIWNYHQHAISINGQEISNLETYTHGVEHYVVNCPQEKLEIWAKGLSIYLQPLPRGEYEIRWFSEITTEFNNGWVVYKPGNFMEIKAILTVE